MATKFRANPVCSFSLSPEIAQSAELAKQFRCMMQEHDASAWLTWRKAARHSPLHYFVTQLQRDAAAVQAALTLPMEHRTGRRTNSSTEADQTPDVRTSQSRSAADSRTVRGLIEPVWCTREGLDPLHQKCGRSGFNVATDARSHELLDSTIRVRQPLAVREKSDDPILFSSLDSSLTSS